MSRNTSARTGQSVLSPLLQQHALDRGHQAAMVMPEHAPISAYVTHQVELLVADYPDLQDAATDELLHLWSTGFQRGVRERVQQTARNQAFMSFMPDHSRGWPSVDEALDDDERAAAHTRITGTLHLPVRRVK